jgi:hypothetical protein
MKTTSMIAGLVIALTSLGASADYDRDHDRRHADRHYDNYPTHFDQRAHVQSERFERAIDQRQQVQRQRIEAGMRNGHLTRYEFRELMEQQRDINRMERRFLADGRLNPREYAAIDRALDRAGREIKQEKWDRQARYSQHSDWRSHY